MQNRYYHTNRRKYNLKAHIVLVTKYRKTLLQNGMDEFVGKFINYPAEQNQWNIIANAQHIGFGCGIRHSYPNIIWKKHTF